jgi:predicted transcriptional regulator of viral defense system
LRDAGVIEAVGIGVYVQTGLVDPALAPIAAATLRQPLATMCLTSALVHHELSDEIPTQTDIALPRGTRPPAGFAHVSWHAFAVDTFTVGRDELSVAGIDVGGYSAERTIVDVFRLAHREGADVAHEALRRWLPRRGSDPSSLLVIARRFPVALPKVRRALEILL